MVPFYGDFDTTETIYIPFNTFDSNDPSASVTVTTLAVTDVHVHKDGSVTQRTSTTGFTLTLNFDSVTGGHLLALDLSDNTDAGFWADGSQYQVRIEGATVDAGNISAFIAAFSIGRTLRPTVAGRTLDVTATGAAGIDWGNVENKTTANDLSGTDIQLCDTVTTATTATNLTNLPTIPANWITAAGINAAALNGKGDWNVGKTGYSLTQAFPTNFADMSITVTTGLVDITQAAADKAWSTAARVLTANTNLNDPTAAVVAAAVWDLDATAHQTTGTFGQAIGDPVANTKTLYAALVTDAVGASVTSDVATVQADLDIITGADGVNLLSATQASIDAIETDTNSLNDTKIPDTISLAAINAQVDTALSDIDLDHWTSNGTAVPAVTAGSYFDQLTDDGTAAFDRTTDSLQAIRDHVGDGTNLTEAGGDGDHLTEAGGTGDQLTAINLPNQTMDITGNLSGSIGSLGATAKSDVNAEVVDALATDTYAEPGQGAPAATTTLAAKINYLYKNWRNRKTQDATTWELYADDATTVDQKATVADDGTDAEKGEIATGP